MDRQAAGGWMYNNNNNNKDFYSAISVGANNSRVTIKIPQVDR